MIGRHDIPMALRAAYRGMHRRTGGWLADLGVTADQFVVLSLLEDGDGVTQQELVSRASSDPNTLRAMLVLLEKRGLLGRTPDPDDRRAVRVTLTAAGKRACKKLAKRIRPLQEGLSALFSDREAETLLDLLGRISKAMGPSDDSAA